MGTRPLILLVYIPVIAVCLGLAACAEFNHMTPKEAEQAARDLGAKAFIPAHVGRFTIANHSWDEPFKQLAEDRDDYPFRLLTPKIGAPVILNAGSSQQFSCWWETTGNCPESVTSGETL